MFNRTLIESKYLLPQQLRNEFSLQIQQILEYMFVIKSCNQYDGKAIICEK